MAIFAKSPRPAFSKKVQREDQRKFFKNRLKRSSHLNDQEALQHKWHYPLISMHFKAKDWTRFRRKQRLQKCPNGKLLQFWQGHPKPAFSKKVQRGDQRKFLKKRLKSSPRLKGPKSLQHKWHYPLISMLLKGKDQRRFCGEKATPKVHERPSEGNFRKVTQSPHFLKTWGTKGNFQKSPKKQPSFKRPKGTLAQMALSRNQYALKVQRLEKIAPQKKLQKCLKGQVFAIFERSPKTRVF